MLMKKIYSSGEAGEARTPDPLLNGATSEI